jgi:hypothetical protein
VTAAIDRDRKELAEELSLQDVAWQAQQQRKEITLIDMGIDSDKDNEPKKGGSKNKKRHHLRTPFSSLSTRQIINDAGHSSWAGLVYLRKDQEAHGSHTYCKGSGFVVSLWREPYPHTSTTLLDAGEAKGSSSWALNRLC